MIKRPLSTGIGLMMLITLLVYANHFNNAFHFDDFHTIINNANIRSLKNIPRFFTDGSTSSVLPQNQAYRPVVVTSLAIDYWLAGDNYASWFQTSTFIFFLLQGLMMVFLFKRIFNDAFKLSPNAWLALIAVTWYMVHPANAETVNYIIARTDVLSTVFVLLGFILYIFSPFCRKTCIYLLAIGVGVLCKATAVMFAPLLFFYILFFEAKLSLPDVFKRVNLKQVWDVFLKTLPAFIFCAFMFWFTDRMTPKTWEPGGTKPLDYLITQPFVILHYFSELFLPTSLSADTDWKLLPSVWDIRFFAGCVFILGMIVTAFYTSKKKRLRPISFGITWFFLTLAPTSSIIPLGEVLNDHRMFFPFIGLVMSVTWLLGLLWMKYSAFVKKEAIIGFIIMLFGAYAYGTWQRNIVWHTEESLWHDVTVKSPQNGRGMMNYALAGLDLGKYDIAEIYLKKAEKLTPDYSFVYTNLGIVEEQKGKMAMAENYYKAGVKLGSKFPDPLYFYARFLTKQSRYDEAVPLLIESIKISPLYLAPRVLLMNIYTITGDWEKLELLCRQTLSFSPQNADALKYLAVTGKKQNELDLQADKIKANPTAEKYADLSMMDYQAGRYPQCIAMAQQALKLKPGFAEAYNNIGAAYIKLYQYNEAIDALKQALKLAPGFALAQNNLVLAEEEIEAKGIKSTKLTAADYIDLSLHYFNSNLYNECIKACNYALILKPDYDIAYNNMCAAYNKLGQWDLAITAANKGLKLNSNNQILKNNLAESLKGENAGGKSN
ncbi:tetratricopeptide repeat protein [Mucilaginibacter sp.]|uniref:tetratricopeptide repeat protein n=1 Tax=Mucilaginibacter sp. TaxID=1882438 RepID=UPI00284CC78E|nr:tetratricopeptide repeat protein [Mucilaginibacter sp.]MDR3697195.1 tetratricopeptide repeat protein [Mucilaginibacter sp.]